MAKRTCDHTTGKIGRQVYLIGRFGQVVREKVIPMNPRSTNQTLSRARFTTVSKLWDTIGQDVQQSWISFAKGFNTKAKLGQYGALTGNEMFVRIQKNLLDCGLATDTTVPELATFGTLVPTGMVITNTGGTIAIKLVAASDVNDYTMVWAAAPVKNGVHRTPHLSWLGLCPTPASGFADITTLYNARFGPAPIGSKVFTGAQQIVNGQQDKLVTWSYVVPETI